MSTQTEFDAYLDGGGKDPAVIKAWTKAIALEAAAEAKAAVEPVLKPAALNSSPEVSTKAFLDQQLLEEHQRRSKIEADQMRERAAAVDHEAEAEREQAYRSLHLGAREGFTPLGPVEGPLK